MTGLRLTSIDLMAFAKALDELAKTSVRVTGFSVHGYYVNLDRREDQMDGITYYITDISKENEVRTGRPIKDNPQA